MVLDQSIHETYTEFCQKVATQRVTLYDGKTWIYYDYGPRHITPLVCLPGTSGTPSIFHRQILALAQKGYRIIAVFHIYIYRVYMYMNILYIYYQGPLSSCLDSY